MTAFIHISQVMHGTFFSLSSVESTFQWTKPKLLGLSHDVKLLQDHAYFLSGTKLLWGISRIQADNFDFAEALIATVHTEKHYVIRAAPYIANRKSLDAK